MNEKKDNLAEEQGRKEIHSKEMSQIKGGAIGGEGLTNTSPDVNDPQQKKANDSLKPSGTGPVSGWI